MTHLWHSASTWMLKPRQGDDNARHHLAAQHAVRAGRFAHEIVVMFGGIPQRAHGS